MDLAQLTPQQWLLAILAALSVGIAKAGFGGVGMLTVTLMATLMPGHEKASTGVVLPLLICGDFLAARAFRKDVQWSYILRLLPPAIIGIVVGYGLMRLIGNQGFKPLIGWLVLALCALQLCRQWKPHLFQSPESASNSRAFSWATGSTAGITTMMANAAGPVMTLYFLTVRLPKMQFVATAAWYFLIVNLIKVPFSYQLGLINLGSLGFNLLLIPIVVMGFFMGRFLLHRIAQRAFEHLLMTLTILAALHLIIS